MISPGLLWDSDPDTRTGSATLPVRLFLVDKHDVNTRLSHYMTAARNLLIYNDLAGALRALHQAGIAVIVLKGATLAATIYPSIADRAMGDADLLVRPGDRDQAKAALESAGYRFLPEPPQRFGPFDTVFTGEMSFRRGNGAIIDLQWELAPVEWFRRLMALDINAVWRDAQPLVLEGVEVLQLSPVDTLLHLCIHMAAHGYAHLAGYSDIVQLLNHHQAFDWDKFLARVRAFRLRTICYFPLEAAFSAFGASIPPSALQAVAPPGWQRWLVRRIADPHRILAGTLPPNKMRDYLLHLTVADRPIDVLRVMAWLFFPGPRWLAERYRLRGRINSWLACLWHPPFVLGQGALSLLALIKVNR